MPGSRYKDDAQSDFLMLCDDLVEISDCCAFICDAFVALVRCECPLDESAARGVSYIAGRLKIDLAMKVEELQAIYQRSYGNGKLLATS